MSYSLKNILDAKDLKSLAPSGVITAFHKGKKVAMQKWGASYKFYDISSLTKIIFTNALLVDLVKTGELNLNKEVRYYLPYMHSAVKVKDLLSHTAGYTWWKPFYKSYPKEMPFELRYSHLKSMIVKEPPKRKQKQAVYSDIDYFILGFLLEELYSESLQSLSHRLEDSFHFCLKNQPLFAKNLYAPTESCSWRKIRLQGAVHDQNAWALGGIAPHAGLFSDAKSLENWFLNFRRNVKRDATWKRFTKRSITKDKGDWALGFMMPSEYKASAGNLFSKKSVGHTGFSGTSLWYDPVVDLGVIVLSNRLHKGVKNKNHIRLRPVIHNTIYKRIILNEY